MVQAIIGFILLYFLPGFLISLLLFKKRDFLEKIILSIGLSILCNVVFGYILGSFKGLTALNLYLLNIILIVVLLVLYRAKFKYFNKLLNFKKSNATIFVVIALIIISIFIFQLIYRVHSDYDWTYQTLHGQYLDNQNLEYDYPMHGDEWTHLAQAVYIMDAKSLGFRNPYVTPITYHRDLESGFHIFTAEHFLLTGLDPSTNYKYLPALFAIISALFIFLFMRKITNDYIALLSMLFFSTLKSNINFLGVWFFIPFTMSFFLLFLYLYFLVDFKSLKNKKELYLLIITFVLSIAIYPFIAALIILITILYYGTKLKKKKQYFFWPIIVVIAILLFVFSKNIPFLKEFVFLSTWTLGTMGTVTYYLIPLIGIINVVLAIVGVYYVFAKKINKLLIIIPILFIINLVIHQFFDLTVLIAYQRSVYYFMLSVVPLSAIGLYYLLVLVKDLLSQVKQFKKISLVIVIIIALVLIAFSFNNYYDIAEQKKISNTKALNLVPLIFLDEDELDAIEFIQENYEPGIGVMANSLMSFGIYPLSKNHVLSIQNANLGTRPYRAKRQYDFLTTNICAYKLTVLREFNISLVVSKHNLDCEKSMIHSTEYTNFQTFSSNLSLKYQNKLYKIYEYKDVRIEE